MDITAIVQGAVAAERDLVGADLLTLAREARRLAEAPDNRCPAAIEALRAMVPSTASTVSTPPWRVMGIDDVFAPLCEVPYLVQHLDLCPGAPALVAGYGFSGKTMAVQSLGLSVATGRSVWGSWSVARRGRVVHIDFEQGARLTSERYQRLAHGMGVTREEIGDRLVVVPLPRVSLATPEGRAMLRELAEGAALVIVDSLRACASELDENSSEIRSVLDTMTSVSEETGAVFVVVHHARKPSRDDAGGAKTSIRGSGAIFDACSSVLVFEGQKGGPIFVSHEKARTSGITCDDFSLVISDVDGRTGLRVDATGETRAERAAEARAAATGRMEAAVLAAVARQPGMGKRLVRASVDGDNGLVDRALGALLGSGRLINRGTDHAWKLHVPSVLDVLDAKSPDISALNDPPSPECVRAALRGSSTPARSGGGDGTVLPARSSTLQHASTPPNGPAARTPGTPGTPAGVHGGSGGGENRVEAKPKSSKRRPQTRAVAATEAKPPMREVRL